MKQQASRSAWVFFLLTIGLGIPFYLLGALVDVQMLPALPIAALGVVCPAIAAVILSHRENRSRGVRDLLARSFDLGRISSGLWLIPAVLLMPVIWSAEYVLMRVTGTALPTPAIDAGRTVGLFLAFFVGAIFEELGWTGYAIGPLQKRFGAFAGAALVGAVWAAWHFIPLAEAHRSFEFVAWWTLGTVATRVIIVWLSNNAGGSVLVAALVHALFNLCWQLFPVGGSLYDPRIMGVLLALVAAIAVTVWGPGTLSRRPAAGTQA